MHGLDDLVDHLRRELRHGRVGAHASGVRSRVVVSEPFEILGRGERRRAGAVGHDEDGRLLALEQLLDHDRVPERPGPRQRLRDLLLRLADEDALARREPVGLDHAGCACLLERRGRRYACRLHHLFRVGLRALDPSRLQRRDRRLRPRRAATRLRRRRRAAPPALRRRGRCGARCTARRDPRRRRRAPGGSVRAGRCLGYPALHAAARGAGCERAPARSRARDRRIRRRGLARRESTTWSGGQSAGSVRR